MRVQEALIVMSRIKAEGTFESASIVRDLGKRPPKIVKISGRVMAFILAEKSLYVAVFAEKAT